MTKEEFEEIIKPLYLMSGKDCQFMRNALIGNFDKWHETKQCNIANVEDRREQLVCDCGNKLTDKELYFGQCLQCDKNIEEAN